MKIKVIQADTRPLKIYTESRNLTYGPPNQMNLGLIASLNNNILIQPNDAISLARTLNLLKCRLMSVSYEFVLGSVTDWEDHGTKAHCWIKIDALINQLKSPENKDVDLFCFLDSDAWVRDEGAFLAFCNEFMKSNFCVAAPLDLEVPNQSYFNSGFLAVKNNAKGLHVMDTIYNHPDYRDYEKRSWHEQSELSIYHERNPGEIMVLPLNDFNTPCGRIVRHCWIKHLNEPLVIEEIIASMTRMALSFTADPNYKIGKDVLLYSSS